MAESCFFLELNNNTLFMYITFSSIYFWALGQSMSWMFYEQCHKEHKCAGATYGC